MNGILIALCLGWATVLWAGPVLEVDRQQVNIRADATVQSTRIAILAAGDRVEKVSEKDEWNQIRLADGRLGWLHGNLVREIWAVTGERVRVRASGSTEAATVAFVEQGQQLAVIQKQGSWFEVALAGGERGWIWRELVEPLDIMTATETQVEVAEDSVEEAQVVAVLTEEADTAEEKAEGTVPLPEGSILNPYAEGLQREADGQYSEALAFFETVLTDDPRHLRALLHAAQAHRELGQFDAGVSKLYRAMELGEGERELAEMYRLMGRADSSAKYAAIAQGLPWSAEPEPVEEGASTADWPEWFWAVVAGAGAVLLLAFSLLFFKKRAPKHSEVVEESPRTKFAKAMEKARPQDVAKGGGEERALERQIEEKRSELRASASVFKGDVKSAEGVDEDAFMDGLLGQLDAFRNALEAQDERARIYAELVRLQNLKIETLERELGLGGKRSR